MIVCTLMYWMMKAKGRGRYVILVTISDILTHKKTFTKISFNMTGNKSQSVKKSQYVRLYIWVQPHKYTHTHTHTLSWACSWYHKGGRLTVFHDLWSNQQHSVCATLSTNWRCRPSKLSIYRYVDMHVQVN